jgi:hypothetical protein
MALSALAKGRILSRYRRVNVAEVASVTNQIKNMASDSNLS